MPSDPHATPVADGTAPDARESMEVLNAGPPLLVSSSALARLLGISIASLNRHRSAGKIGPRPLRLGGSVRWRRETVEAWLAESERAGRLLTMAEWDALDTGAGR